MDNRKMRQIRERKSGTVELSFEPRNMPNTENDTKIRLGGTSARQGRRTVKIRATLDRCFHTAPTADLILDSPRSVNGHSWLRAEPGRGALFEEGLRSQTLMPELMASIVPRFLGKEGE